nr:hypothetical protein CFP56_02959 [Quercus suber]
MRGHLVPRVMGYLFCEREWIDVQEVRGGLRRWSESGCVRLPDRSVARSRGIKGDFWTKESVLTALATLNSLVESFGGVSQAAYYFIFGSESGQDVVS